MDARALSDRLADWVDAEIISAGQASGSRS